MFNKKHPRWNSVGDVFAQMNWIFLRITSSRNHSMHLVVKSSSILAFQLDVSGML